MQARHRTGKSVQLARRLAFLAVEPLEHNPCPVPPEAPSKSSSKSMWESSNHTMKWIRLPSQRSRILVEKKDGRIERGRRVVAASVQQMPCPRRMASGGVACRISSLTHCILDRVAPSTIGQKPVQPPCQMRHRLDHTAEPPWLAQKIEYCSRDVAFHLLSGRAKASKLCSRCAAAKLGTARLACI